MKTHTRTRDKNPSTAATASKPFRYLALVAILLGTLTQVGCIGATGKSTPSASTSQASSTPASPTTPPTAPPAGAGQLSLSSSTLSFGSVNTGASSVLPVSFTNAGNSNITILNVAISGPGFTAAGGSSGLSSGLIVAPGQAATLNVTFAPAATGAVAGSLTVSSNATNAVASIGLSGTGTQFVAHSVELKWTADNAVIGYNVYRSNVSGGPYNAMNPSPMPATAYTDSTVQDGQTYYYVVSSVNSSNVDSSYSSEVSALVPNN